MNLCSYLALEGYKVLAIDIDPQGNTTSGLGIDKKNLRYSAYDVISSDISAEEAILESELIKNLYVIPSTMELAGAEVELMNKKDKEVILRDKLDQVKDKFDYIFIDCPPSLGFLTINSLAACNSVLIPIQCEFYALEGVGQLVNTIQLIKKSLNKDIEIEGILMSMYDGRVKLANEVVSEVRKFFKDKVYDTTIPRNIRLAEAPSYGLPIALYDNKCRGASSYEDLAKEFIKRQGGDSIG
ncbi:ParA family protein [Clostridium algidicarnis]|nr:ParA family protein [Clostridium algidicarnis]MBU3228703.1 ParA family protein [Clostridium algidicarnis]MBU3251251.1 ParA family protein [Clostridium algidicarnis]